MLWRKEAPINHTPFSPPKFKTSSETDKGVRHRAKYHFYNDKAVKECGFIAQWSVLYFPSTLRRFIHKVIINWLHWPVACWWDWPLRITAQRGRAQYVLPTGSWFLAKKAQVVLQSLFQIHKSDNPGWKKGKITRGLFLQREKEKGNSSPPPHRDCVFVSRKSK